jgi:preprotein translocase subunit SecF
LSLTIAAILTVISLGAMVVNSFPGGKFDPAQTFNYTLDFTGGTVTELHFTQPVEVEQVRQLIEKSGKRSFDFASRRLFAETRISPIVFVYIKRSASASATALT